MLDAPTDLTVIGAPSTDWWEKPSFLALATALAAIPLNALRLRLLGRREGA